MYQYILGRSSAALNLPDSSGNSLSTRITSLSSSFGFNNRVKKFQRATSFVFCILHGGEGEFFEIPRYIPPWNRLRRNPRNFFPPSRRVQVNEAGWNCCETIRRSIIKKSGFSQRAFSREFPFVGSRPSPELSHSLFLRGCITLEITFRDKLLNYAECLASIEVARHAAVKRDII